MPVIPGPDVPPILADDLGRIRAAVNDPTGSEQLFSDDEYSLALSRLGSVNRTAAYFWGLRASKYAELTDISEAGSSRSQSRLYQQALEMQKFYTGLADKEDADNGVISGRRTRIGQITRVKVDSK